jgi:hypothetical protein
MPELPRPLLQEAVFRVLGLPLPPRGGASPQAGGGDQSESTKVQPRAPSAKFPDLPAQRLLSPDEIKRELRRFRYDHSYRGQNRVPLKTLGDFCGLGRDAVWDALMRGEMSQRTRTLLSGAIIAIMEGKLRFRRHGQVWQQLRLVVEELVDNGLGRSWTAYLQTVAFDADGEAGRYGLTEKVQSVHSASPPGSSPASLRPSVPDTPFPSVQACIPAWLLDKSSFLIRAELFSCTDRKVSLVPISSAFARLHASEGGRGSK